MSFENRYSRVDRLLHSVAFSTAKLQISLSDIEDRLYSRQLDQCEIDRPVFITAIPRAGTTLLLELLVKQGEFASHCYRDMPFVLMPMLWDRLSKPFRKTDAPRERAHGDGMLINVDSPEAFEEIVWKAFWKKHYKGNYISPWQSEQGEEFDQFLRNHLRKIISLRALQAKDDVRYVSKNNLNIARIGSLLRIFPDARIVLPFRDPVQHAASLLKQHMNFMKIHEKDSFAMKYMEAIGHYDFGINLRPVDFDQWYSAGSPSRPDTLDFWLQYWTASYRHLKQKAGSQVVMLNYDALCENAEKGLGELADFLHLERKSGLVDQSSFIRAAKPHDIDTTKVSPAILEEAKDLYEDLKSISMV